MSDQSLNIDPNQVQWDVPVPQPVAQPSPNVNEPVELDPSQVTWDKDKYGTLPAQAKLVAQELAQGYAGPVATAAEKGLSALGVPVLTPEEREQAAAVNPITAGIAQAVGLGAGLMTGTGEAALLGKAGAAGAKLLATGAEMSRARAAGAAALRGAIELGGFGAGDEISNWIAGKPDQTVQSAISHIGLSALLGAGTGGVLGFALPKTFGEVAPEVEQNLKNFQNTVQGTVADVKAEAPLQQIKEAGLLSRFKKLKPEAQGIVQIGEAHQWPVYEGMVSSAPEIEMAEDALLNGPPTVVGIHRRQAYEKAADAVRLSVDEASAAPLAPSETAVGNTIKSGLLGNLETKNEPIKALYSEISPYRQTIPVVEKEAKSLGSVVNDIIKDKGLVPGSERYNFIKTFSGGLENVENLQQLANFRTEVGRSAGPLTRDLAQDISEKLNGVEEKAIQNFANTMETGEAKDRILNLISKSNEAKKSYATFREELQTLGNSLGKKKIYGPQNFMDFIEDLNPQTLAKRTFSPGNTEFAQYLAEKFPDQFKAIRDYQRGLLREEALTNGELDMKKLVKKVNNLEPELKDLLYSENEQVVLNDAKKYLDSFPKSFNPSGTSHMSAFRAFFEHPTGAVIANLRDAGIQAFIKAANVVVPGADKEAGTLIKVLGPTVAQGQTDAAGFAAGVKAVMSAIKAYAKTVKAADAVFTGAMPVINEASHEQLKKLDDHLEDLKTKPQPVSLLGSDLGKFLPDHATALSMSAANAMNSLNAMRPQNPKMAPLDKAFPVNMAQGMPYLRNLAMANQPLLAFKHIKNGTLLPQDVKAIQTVAPAKYQLMSQMLAQSMNEHIEKGGTIPNHVRQSLSLFLGQPMDSTFTPQGLQSIQSTFAGLTGPAPQQQMKPQRKGSTSALSKLPHTLMTGVQAREARANKI